MDLFDPKPQLAKAHGKQPPEPIDTEMGAPGPLMKSPFKFRQYSKSGAWVCEHYPHLAGHVDEIAFIKSCYGVSPAHLPSMFLVNTGSTLPGFPSAGAWTTYGLGTENKNLPGFVVLQNVKGTKGGPFNWGAGFLPSSFQGTPFRTEGTPLLNLARPKDVTDGRQRRMLDLAAEYNRAHRKQHPDEPDLLAWIASYELAYQMQTTATEAVDLSQESSVTQRLYGLDEKASQAFGEKCLLARRLVERGVRFVQVYSDDERDAHSNLEKNLLQQCRQTDRPIAWLLSDLKQRGLLDSTLVIWGGEFGRMPISEGDDGRDHNPHGFLTWMAGGRVQGGSAVRRDGRHRIQRRRRSGLRPRPPRDDPAPVGPRSHEPDLQAQRPPLPPDRRRRQRAVLHHCLIADDGERRPPWHISRRRFGKSRRRFQTVRLRVKVRRFVRTHTVMETPSGCLIDRILIAAAFPCLFSTSLLLADDWPPWMGPQRDGVWRESGIIERFPGSGATILWRSEIDRGQAGPAAEEPLTALPVELTTWQDWQARYPATKVLSPQTGHQRNYQGNPYTGYFDQPQLMFPARPTSDRLPTKARVLGVWTENAARAYPESAFSRQRNRAEEQIGGKKVVVEFNPDARSLRVVEADDGVQWMYSLWFAWYALRPQTTVFE